MNESALTFVQVREKIYTMHPTKQYQAALDLLEAQIKHFEKPVEIAKIIYWRACFLCLVGQADEAMYALAEALGQGYWWNGSMLANDDDLAHLRHRPAFAVLITECERRQAVAEAEGAATLRLVVSPESAPPYPLVIGLHGYGSNAEVALAEWSPMTGEGWLVAALQSSQVADMDGYHWNDEARAIQDITFHLDELAQAYALDETRLMVGGFSNGSRTALRVTLTGAIKARYVVAIGGSLSDETLAALDWKHIREGNPPRILMMTGEHDSGILERLQHQAEIFAAQGLDVTMQVIPTAGHVVPTDLIERIRAWLD